MKKQLSLASKRKWVTGGILAFSAVSLLTTGFATWVVGVQKVAQERDLTVVVDTASNSTVRITAELSDEKVVLVEPVAPEAGEFVSFKAGSGDLAAVDPLGLQIEFSSLKVVYGTESGFSYSKIKFELATLNDDGIHTTADPLVKVTTDGLRDLTGVTSPRSGEEWTYLDAPVEIALTAGTKTENASAGTTTIEFSGDSLKANLQWGTFFENGDKKSPAAFYNSVFTKTLVGSVTDDDQYTAWVDAVTAELNAMHQALDGKELHIVASLAA